MHLRKCFIYVLFIFLLTIVLSACGQEVDSIQPVKDDKQVSSSQEKKDSQPKNDVKKEQSKKQQTEKPKPKEAAQPKKETKPKPKPKPKSKSLAKLPTLEVHYIDVGQADATLFKYGEHVILFDTGDWKRNDTIQYLKSQNIKQIDLVIISHPHADHIGQLAEVMNTFKVKEVWMSGNTQTSATFQNALKAVLDSGANYEEPRSGEKFAIGDMQMTVVYPKSISGDLNNESTSVLFTYGKVKFLFTGDAEKKGEADMVASGQNLQAQILQLGHHGSNTSTTSAFYNAVNPEVAIYSAGTGNSYGHPNKEVIQRVQNSKAKLYGTDVNGTIIVNTNGVNYTIKTNKDGTVSPKSQSKKKPQSKRVVPKPEPKKTQEQKPANSNCVNINKASEDNVQRIIHIGPARSKDLIDSRPYHSVDELSKIKGIGPARIKDIKEQGLACAS